MVCFVTESIKCILMYRTNVPSSFQHNSEAGGQQGLPTLSIFSSFYILENKRTAKLQNLIYTQFIWFYFLSLLASSILFTPSTCVSHSLLHYIIILIFNYRGDGYLIVYIHRCLNLMRKQVLENSKSHHDIKQTQTETSWLSFLLHIFLK